MSQFTPTRRTAIRTGVLAAMGLVPLGAESGPAAGSADRPGAEPSARIYAADFHPDARFRVVSEPLAYEPETRVQEGEVFLADLYWNDYGTRIIRYANTAERVLFFPPLNATVAVGDTYRMGRISSVDGLDPGIVTVGYRPALADTDSG